MQSLQRAVRPRSLCLRVSPLPSQATGYTFGVPNGRLSPGHQPECWLSYTGQRQLSSRKLIHFHDCHAGCSGRKEGYPTNAVCIERFARQDFSFSRVCPTSILQKFSFHLRQTPDSGIINRVMCTSTVYEVKWQKESQRLTPSRVTGQLPLAERRENISNVLLLADQNINRS